MPRGPPRPVDRGTILGPIFDEEDTNSAEANESNAASLSAILMRKNELSRSQLINYATFRQNISAEAAAAAQKRAEMVTAQLARHWSNEDLRIEAKEAKQESSDSSSNSSQITEGDRVSSPSPPSRRSRSSSPGKTVTFVENVNESSLHHQDDRSLNELDASPRRMMAFANLKEAASGIGFNLLSSKKRQAPSPPNTASNSLQSEVTEAKIELSDEEDEDEAGGNKHEILGAKLSASLRATFGLKNVNNPIT